MTERFARKITTRVPRMGNDGIQVGWQDGPIAEMNFELTIDLEGIKAEVASTAARNTSRKAVDMSGLVKCRVIGAF